MSVIRHIYIKVTPGQRDEVERIWKEDCAPLMIRQKGCMSERLLKCEDVPGEYISASEWEDEAAIEEYRKSDDHEVIKNHARGLQGTRAEVKLYHVMP